MSQQTLNAFFNVRKKPVDQHAARRRKVILEDGPEQQQQQLVKTQKIETPSLIEKTVVISKSTKAKEQHSEEQSVKEEATTSVVTSVLDDHLVRPIPFPQTPKSAVSKAENKRSHKRDQAGVNVDELSNDVDESVRFTIGKKSIAKKKLEMQGDESDKGSSKAVLFHKLGNLSPVKKSPTKNVILSKEGNPSPVKKALFGAKELSEIKAQAAKIKQNLLSIQESPTKLTPQEVKAKLGKVTKLSDLQAKLRQLDSAPSRETTASLSSHRRALFAPPQSDGPKLSQNSLTMEILKENKPKPPPSPIKASPRKAVLEAPILTNMPQPDSRLPLPRKYKFLAEVFDIVDQIVSMKHNRKEIIRVNDIKPAVQNVLRKTFNENYLKQIRCVFPAAYIYTWERMRDRMGRDSNNFELQMEVNMKYQQGLEQSIPETTNEKKKVFQNLTPAAKVERVKVFKHNLLTIVQDHHRDFLKSNGIIVKANLLAWHKDFDLETLPDVDEVEFPPKPHVEKVTTAQEMIQRLGQGLNPRLENVLKQTAAAETKEPEEAKKPAGDVKILKGLQGLSPELLAMLKAREAAKQIKNMTQSSQEQKELEMMEELVTIAPYIVNCHRSQKSGAAVPSETLYKVVSDSYGRKSPKDTGEIIRLFIKLVPECMEFKTYEKIEYIKQKKPCPDINQIRAKLEKLVEAKKKSF